jgi:hypothetical protein
MEWWSHFLDLLTSNVYFRAGFAWGVGVAVALWGVVIFCNNLYARWLKMRQFFEPIKKPGKAPVETGPSPASMMFGCLGQIVLTLVVLATVVAALMWWANP